MYQIVFILPCAFNKAEFETAYQLFSGLADKNIAEAQMNIGIIFEKGKGVLQTSQKPSNGIVLQANQGLNNAQYNLSLMYAYGKGVSQYNKEATKWFQLVME